MATNVTKGNRSNTKWLGGILIMVFVLGVVFLVGPFDLSSTQTSTQERDATSTPSVDMDLYHYTNCFSANSIVIDGFIAPSIKSQGGYAVFGDGVYLSDLPPDGLLNKSEYSSALFGSTNVQDKTSCWILVRIPRKEVTRARAVYTDKLPKPRQIAVGSYTIYVRLGTQNMPFTYVDRGKTTYAP